MRQITNTIYKKQNRERIVCRELLGGGAPSIGKLIGEGAPPIKIKHKMNLNLNYKGIRK